MGPEKLILKVYAGLVGAVTTMLAQKLMTAAWKIATGEEPPKPTDPETPVVTAVSWALASGIGVGVTQLLTKRVLARRWANEVGLEAAQPGKLRLKI